MLSSSYENLGFDSAVTNMYTANSVASLVKTTIDTAIAESKDNGNEIKDSIKDSINYNDEGSEKSIAQILKDYAEKTSQYIKDLNADKAPKKLTKEDYEKVGMGGYYQAQMNLKYSQLLTNYMKSNLAYKVTNTFSIDV